MRTISLIAQKGGSGKTTLALHLAAAFSASGASTLVLDLDPQTSAMEWKDARGEPAPEVESIVPSRLARAVGVARESGADVLILDTAPHAEATALEAARHSDLILVPCRPSIMDLRALRKTVDLLRLAGSSNVWAVMNGVDVRGTVADEAAEFIATDLGLPVCPVRIADRVALSRCLIEGRVAQEIEPTGKAAAEVRQFYKWACEHVRWHGPRESEA